MNRLLLLREEKGISQENIAKLLSVTRQAYSRYERGERELGYEALLKLSQFFDVSIDYLLGYSDFYYPDKVKTTQDYTAEERQLIEAFRELPADSKKLVLRMVGVSPSTQASKKKV